MPFATRCLAAGALAVCCSLSGCTIAKPIVGVFTGPVMIFAHTDGDWGGCSCGNGEGLVYAFAAMSVVGVVGGLVTGIISDIQVLTGAAKHDPARNWWDPFATNTSACK